MENIQTLEATNRNSLGTGSARDARRRNKIPCVVYSKNKQNMHIEIEYRSLFNVYKSGLFTSKTLDLLIGNDKIKVVPKKVDLHPVNESIMHVDFVILGEENHVLDVPVRFINREKSQGVKRGGFFNINIRKIKINCNSKNIPSVIEFDCIDLVTGSKIKASDIQMPEGCFLLSKKDLVLASIIGKAGKEEDLGAKPEATSSNKK